MQDYAHMTTFQTKVNFWGIEDIHARNIHQLIAEIFRYSIG